MYGECIIGYFPGISSEPKFLTTNFKWWSPLSTCVDFNRMRCTNTHGGPERGVCASSGSMVARSVARISTECGVRIRKADERVCVRAVRAARVQRDCQLPLRPFPQPLSPPCIRVCGLCQLCMVEQRFVPCAEGVLQ